MKAPPSGTSDPCGQTDTGKNKTEPTPGLGSQASLQLPGPLWVKPAPGSDQVTRATGTENLFQERTVCFPPKSAGNLTQLPMSLSLLKMEAEDFSCPGGPRAKPGKAQAQAWHTWWRQGPHCGLQSRDLEKVSQPWWVEWAHLKMFYIFYITKYLRIFHISKNILKHIYLYS